MEHEVFVPLPPETLRQVLGDPARVARCIPGLQQDADEASGPLSGRLKVRVGGHTITYRGVLRIAAQGEDFAVEGEGAEARGHGSVKLALTIRPRAAEAGTVLAFTGTVGGDGRIKEFPAEAAESAATRLLDRFAAQLASTAGAMAEAEADRSDEAEAVEDDEGVPEAEAQASVFETEVPPPSLDPLLDDVQDDIADDIDGDADSDVDRDLDRDLNDGFDASRGVPDELPAEAAHARRTMIGRSAEEVDHAPPRGRYAPVPAPDSGSTADTLRWVAPAAALVIASAVVVGRVLRRRR
ncbi:SRPBCC domain-containing protein [Streptomyces sp. A3M-1-3]|uniref:SRPBCC family protein n=1 Tax=Streptomyces sp. A3M-1-3 TaxID=2962044 RepID=UPI0020B75965|nr:SRPBCC family protein [Streptomyces sp. A3M-1-3]MCP3822540.1 SRPBCC domain-containing protein [Streptomyces sp. A3M-1-3]